jgi:hypothetical protein
MRGVVGVISTPLNSDIDASITPKVINDISGSIDVRQSDYDFAIGSIYVVHGESSDINSTIIPRLYSEVDGSIEIRYYNLMTVNVTILEPPREIEYLSPIKDALIRSENPLVNYGFEQDLIIGNSGIPEVMRTLMQWDISSIPDDMTIEKAEILLHHATSFSTEFAMEVFGVDASWEEGTVNWEIQPGVTVKLSEANSGIGYTTISIDITDAFTDWYRDTVVNNGVMIKSKIESAYDIVRYFSREGDIPPTLKVTYYDPLIRLTIGRSYLDASIISKAFGYNDLSCSVTPKSYDVVDDMDSSLTVVIPWDRDCSISVTHPTLECSIFVGYENGAEVNASIDPIIHEDLSCSIYANSSWYYKHFSDSGYVIDKLGIYYEFSAQDTAIFTDFQFSPFKELYQYDWNTVFWELKYEPVFSFDEFFSFDHDAYYQIMQREELHIVEKITDRGMVFYESFTVQEKVLDSYFYFQDTITYSDIGYMTFFKTEAINFSEYMDLGDKDLYQYDPLSFVDHLVGALITAFSELPSSLTPRVKGANEILGRLFVGTQSYVIIELETEPPQDPYLIIADGIAVTKNEYVPIELGTSDLDTSTYTMKIWGDVDPEYDPNIQVTEEESSWIIYHKFSYIMLSGSTGYKNIYAKISNSGNDSIVVFDDIIFNKNIDDINASLTSRVSAEEFLEVKIFVNTGASSIILELDTTPPQEVIVTLSDGATQTREDYVKLQIVTSDENTTGYWMKVWGDINPNYDLEIYPNIETRIAVDFPHAVWMPYEEVKYLMLSSGKGTKTIYVVMMDDVGNEGDIATDTIYYLVDHNPYSKFEEDINTDITSYASMEYEDEGGLESDSAQYGPYSIDETPRLVDKMKYIELIFIQDIPEMSMNVMIGINLFDYNQGSEFKYYLNISEWDIFDLQDIIVYREITFYEDLGMVDLVSIWLYDEDFVLGEDGYAQIDLVNLIDDYLWEDYITDREMQLYEHLTFNEKAWIEIDQVINLYELAEIAWIELIYLTEDNSIYDLITIAVSSYDLGRFNEEAWIELYQSDFIRFWEFVFINIISYDSVNYDEILIGKEFMEYDSSIEVVERSTLYLMYLLDILTPNDRFIQIDLINLVDSEWVTIDYLSILEKILYETVASNDYLTEISINTRESLNLLDVLLNISLGYIYEDITPVDVLVSKEVLSYEILPCSDICKYIEILVREEIEEEDYLERIELRLNDSVVSDDNIIELERVFEELIIINDGAFIFGEDINNKDYTYPGNLGDGNIPNPLFPYMMLPDEVEDYPYIPEDTRFGVGIPYHLPTLIHTTSDNENNTTSYILGKSPNIVHIHYNLLSSGNITVKYNNITIATTGTTIGSGVLQFNYDYSIENVYTVDVIVTTTNTWSYTIISSSKRVNPNYLREETVTYGKHPLVRIPNPKWGLDILPTDSDYPFLPSNPRYGETIHVLTGLPYGYGYVDGSYVNAVTNKEDVIKTYKKYVGYGEVDLTIDCQTGPLGMFYSRIQIYHDATLIYQRSSMSQSNPIGFIDHLAFDTNNGKSPYLTFVLTCWYAEGWNGYNYYDINGFINFTVSSVFGIHYLRLPSNKFYEPEFIGTPRAKTLTVPKPQPLPALYECDIASMIKMYASAPWDIYQYSWDIFDYFTIEELYDLVTYPNQHLLDMYWVYGNQCIDFVESYTQLDVSDEDLGYFNDHGYLSYKEIYNSELYNLLDSSYIGINPLDVYSWNEYVYPIDVLSWEYIGFHEYGWVNALQLVSEQVTSYEYAKIGLILSDSYTEKESLEINLVDEEIIIVGETVSDRYFSVSENLIFVDELTLNVIVSDPEILGTDILTEILIKVYEDLYAEEFWDSGAKNVIEDIEGVDRYTIINIIVREEIYDEEYLDTIHLYQKDEFKINFIFYIERILFDDLYTDDKIVDINILVNDTSIFEEGSPVIYINGTDEIYSSDTLTVLIGAGIDYEAILEEHVVINVTELRDYSLDVSQTSIITIPVEDSCTYNTNMYMYKEMFAGDYIVAVDTLIEIGIFLYGYDGGSTEEHCVYIEIPVRDGYILGETRIKIPLWYIIEWIPIEINSSSIDVIFKGTEIPININATYNTAFIMQPLDNIFSLNSNFDINIKYVDIDLLIKWMGINSKEIPFKINFEYLTAFMVEESLNQIINMNVGG